MIAGGGLFFWLMCLLNNFRARYKNANHTKRVSFQTNRNRRRRRVIDNPTNARAVDSSRKITRLVSPHIMVYTWCWNAVIIHISFAVFGDIWCISSHSTDLNCCIANGKSNESSEGFYVSCLWALKCRCTVVENDSRQHMEGILLWHEIQTYSRA